MGQDAWGPERRRGPWRELVFQENKLGPQEQLRREHSDIVPESVPGGFHSPGLGGPALAGCPCGPESLLLRGRRLWEPPGGPTGHARSHTSAPETRSVSTDSAAGVWTAVARPLPSRPGARDLPTPGPPPNRASKAQRSLLTPRGPQQLQAPRVASAAFLTSASPLRL